MGDNDVRVIVVASTETINSIYRALPLLELRRLGHEVELDVDGRAMHAGRPLDADVVHIYRYFEPGTRRWARQLREAGVAVVWDNDDDLTRIPKNGKGALRSQQMGAQIRELLASVHLVTTTSELLADQYRAGGAAEVRVVENFLPDSYSGPRERTRTGVTIGWTAGMEHRQDFEALHLREPLERLLAAHPDVHLVSVGLPLGLPRDRCTHLALVPYHELGRHVASFDIGIAPIADVAFNRARSNVKLKEYAAMGVPWLASPIGPYAGHGERQGGRLVPDDRWYEELDRLVFNERARRKLAKRGVKWGEAQRLERNLHAWETAMERAVTLARGSVPSPA